MHAKSDSEVTSLPGSSPPRSPRTAHLRQPPPAYYVQSPSRDSHDGGDSKLSFQSTPLLSPLGSPLHPLAHSSTSSSLSRSKHNSGHHHHVRGARVQPQPAHTAAGASIKHKDATATGGYDKKLLPSTIYEDEAEYGSSADSKSITASQIYTTIFVIISCIVFLFLFILFFWLICRPSRPVLSIKNILFHNLYLGQGTDASGVPSMLLTVNASVQLDFENRSRYFGAHLNPLSAVLQYSELTVASQEMGGYVQGKSSRKVISIVVGSEKVPLYGASTITSTQKPSVALSALVSVCSHYYVVGQMVKSQFCTSVACNLAVSSTSMVLLTPIKSACTYS